MAYSGLQAFLKKLESRGELVRVTAGVSPELEITELADRLSKMGGKALLCQRVEGSPYPVAINVMGTEARMALALGAERLDDIGADVARYLDFGNYASVPRLFRFLPHLLRLLCCFPLRHPGRLKRPPCREVIERTPDLGTLPVLRCWPLDGGRFITLPLVFTKYPHSKNQNVGMYRMQILDKNTTAMHWHKHKDGSSIYEAWQKEGGRMPVSVALGGDPALTYAATAPLPPKLDEMMLAGFLRRRNVSMVKCLTNDLYVPAGAEFILEGYVDTGEAPCWEGPFGDHTGYYSLEDWYPKFHVTCLTHRRRPVYPATVVGRPPMEDCFLAKATERIFLPVLKMQIPQLVNLNLPLEGVFHNCAILAVRPDFPGAARTAMNAVWGMGQMRYTKLVVTVDGGVDPYDIDAVLQRVLSCDFGRDLILDLGPLDALDHASDAALLGARAGLDATGTPTGTPGKLLLLPVEKKAAWDGRKAGRGALAATDAKLILLLDHTVDLTDRKEVFWRVLNNIDGGRDFTVLDGRLAVDATKKWPDEGLTRPWPEDIVMSAEIKERVDRRWREYGLE